MELDKTYIIEIIIRSQSGNSLNESVAEIIKLSVEKECNIRLIHNGNEYLVKYESLIKQVKEIENIISA